MKRLNRKYRPNAWNTILSPAEVISAAKREGVGETVANCPQAEEASPNHS
jgi:hypothetical protein